MATLKFKVRLKYLQLTKPSDDSSRYAPYVSCDGWRSRSRFGEFGVKKTVSALNRISTEDIRSFCGTQEFVANAPLNLIYVANFSRLGKRKDELGSKIGHSIILFSD